MLSPLDPIDVRVLGALIEKSMTTPDYYPLSLNALTHACSQSSNRDPVMQVDEAAVVAATDRLRRQSLVRAMQKSDSRVMKYSHLVDDALNLDVREQAVLCVLMLRGPQTIGEIKTRTARLADFATVGDVEAMLNGLISREEQPLVARLPRRPGQKEARYTHLLAGAVSVDTPASVPVIAAPEVDRVGALEAAVQEMRQELTDIRGQLDQFRKQFE